MKRTSEATELKPPQAQVPSNAAPLPTHGGVFEFNPSTQTMRQIEGAAAEADAPQAPTGEQA